MQINFLFTVPAHLPRESIQVSLLPEVSYELSQKEISYKIPEDFLPDKLLFADEASYFKQQLNWMHLFDDFVKSKVAFCRDFNIPMASSCYLRLKYWMDTLVLHDRAINSLLKQSSPSKVCCFSNAVQSASYSVFKFHQTIESSLIQLFSFICQTCAIPFEVCSSPFPMPETQKQIAQKNESPSRFHAFLKTIYAIHKYNKFFKYFIPQTSYTDKSYLILHTGSPEMDLFVKKLIASRSSVYVYEKEAVICESDLLRRSVKNTNFDESSLSQLKMNLDSAAEALESNLSPLVELGRFFTRDMREYLKPYLRHFIRVEMFEILSLAAKNHAALQPLKLSQVLARGNTDPRSLAILLGSRYLAKVPTTCVQHASSGLGGESMGMYDTTTYDSVIARDKVSMHYLRQHPEIKIPILCSSHYLQRLALQQKLLRTLPRFLLKSCHRNSVLYVEKKFVHRLRGFNENMYSPTEYFEFQKKVILFFDQLTRRKNWKLIYKHGAHQTWSEKSLLPLIRQTRNPRLTISDKPFTKALSLADRVIVDYPSGSFFEAAACGKSVLCIVPSYFRISDSAKSIFGCTLRTFESREEAIDLIDQFIHTNADTFRINFPFHFTHSELIKQFGFTFSESGDLN